MNAKVPAPEPESSDARGNQRSQRLVRLAASVVISLAVVGFGIGIREPEPRYRPVPIEAATPTTTIPVAVTYTELTQRPIKVNARWRQSLADLKVEPVEKVVLTEELKRAALADRAKNRAYDGAPPTIPHPISTQSANGCLACHGQGLRIGDRIASKMSHPLMTNCTQCHVEQVARSEPTNFVGLYRSGPGDRANPAAPPTIPHHTWLRQDCVSCHGEIARPGTRTLHPWLTNCLQCHAPSMALDQLAPKGEHR